MEREREHLIVCAASINIENQWMCRKREREREIKRVTESFFLKKSPFDKEINTLGQSVLPWRQSKSP